MAFPIYPHVMRSVGDGEGSGEKHEDRPSIWKRDISLGQKKNKDEQPEQTPVASPEPEAEAAEGRTSIWKREISFGRKKKPGVAAAEPADVPELEDAHEPEPEPAPLPAPLPEPQPEPEPEPDWPEPAAADDPPAVAYPDDDLRETIAALREQATRGAVEAEAVSEERPSLWKRDLSFRRKKEAAAEPEPAPEAPTTAEEPPPTVEPRRRWKNKVKAEAEPKPAKAPRTSLRGPTGGKKLVGLKIGASQIAAAHVRNDEAPEVLGIARMPLDRGVVVSGELRDPDALAAALRVFFKQNKLPKRDVRLGIASNRVGVRVLEVTGVEDPKLLGNAVRFRAQEVLPIPLSEAVLDYRVLRERTEPDGTLTREVLVAFAYRELVDRYAAVCRSAGLKLMGIDLDGFAMLRALVDRADDGGRVNGAAVVAVSLGHDRSIMSVSDGAVCEFTRVIEWGGASLDTAVARILALTPSQAEPIKRELTLIRDTQAPDGLTPEQAGRARTAMLQEVHAFAREVVSSLQFYQAQPGSLDIGEIVVTGGTAHMPGLVEQLQELIGVSVRVGDPLARVVVGKKVSLEEPIGSLALAIGLGLED